MNNMLTLRWYKTRGFQDYETTLKDCRGLSSRLQQLVRKTTEANGHRCYIGKVHTCLYPGICVNIAYQFVLKHNKDVCRCASFQFVKSVYRYLHQSTRKSMAHDPWFMSHGPWSMVRGPWPMVPGPWSIVHRPWSMVYTFRKNMPPQLLFRISDIRF